MNVSDIYQTIAYMLWGLGEVFLIIIVVIFYKLKIANVLRGMRHHDAIITPSYIQTSKLNNTMMLSGTKETETLLEETQLLMGNHFHVIYQIIETHTDEMI